MKKCCSLNDLWISFRYQTSLLISKAFPPVQMRTHSLHKPYYTHRVKRATQRRRGSWTSRKDSSNDTNAIAYLRLHQEQRKPWPVLRAERLTYEWKLANTPKISAAKCFTCNHQYDFSIRAGLFTNKQPTEIVNASSVKSFKTLLDANWLSLFPCINDSA